MNDSVDLFRDAQTAEATMSMAVSQFQRVALTRDVAEHQLCAGDVACVVDLVPHPSGGETGCVLEVFNAIGESIAVVAVPLSAVEPLAADEVFAVRRLNDLEIPAPSQAP
jgi:hypothetical protein